MLSPTSTSAVDVSGPVAAKFRLLGLDGERELLVFLGALKVRSGIVRGKDIGSSRSTRHLTVLLRGLACSYQMLEDGGRHIHAFQYPGDFCNLSVSRERNDVLISSAVDTCSIGTIDYETLDDILGQHPKLGQILWRAAMLEAGIARERMVNVGRRSARENVAHLLCEQLHRRKAIGIHSRVIPLTQVELADAAGLSAVHMNRIIQELRNLTALSPNPRMVEVGKAELLAKIGNFDGKYLTVTDVLGRWEVRTSSG